jgi:succinylarginine dihydrolase
MNLVELQIDRLVGPTHHFGGLGVGNLASHASAGHVSNPAAAALQGLDKMRLVASLGIPQLILPPQHRPDFTFLRSVGFAGADREILKRALDQAPELLSAAFSCSAMWTANAATVTPGIDSGQSKANVTIANLDASVHRAIEASQTECELQQLLAPICQIHSPLRGGAALRDEGAANHMRLGSRQDHPGINLFVYGDCQPTPETNWPRQTRAASEAIARLHGLREIDTFFLKQHPRAIDAGAFHNDVVAISHQDLFIHHEFAFLEDESAFRPLQNRFSELASLPLRRIEIGTDELSIDDAVKTYLFNSQIISTPDSDRPTIICASQVAEHPGAKLIVDRWLSDGVFADVRFVDLGQSMSGGGGPACLRLRVPIPAETVNTVGRSRWTPDLDGRLRELIDRKYPTSLTIDDLAGQDYHQHASGLLLRIKRVLDAS